MKDYRKFYLTVLIHMTVFGQVCFAQVVTEKNTSPTIGRQKNIKGDHLNISKSSVKPAEFWGLYGLNENNNIEVYEIRAYSNLKTGLAGEYLVQTPKYMPCNILKWKGINKDRECRYELPSMPALVSAGYLFYFDLYHHNNLFRYQLNIVDLKSRTRKSIPVLARRFGKQRKTSKMINAYKERVQLWINHNQPVSLYEHDGKLYASLGTRLFEIGFLKAKPKPRVILKFRGHEMKYKRIDDFAFHKGMLLALDNVILPKYIIVFDISKTRRPRVVCRKRIRSGPGEYFKEIHIHNNKVMILSVIGNRGGCASRISTYNISDVINPKKELPNNGMIHSEPCAHRKVKMKDASGNDYEVNWLYGRIRGLCSFGESLIYSDEYQGVMRVSTKNNSVKKWYEDEASDITNWNNALLMITKYAKLHLMINENNRLKIVKSYSIPAYLSRFAD